MKIIIYLWDKEWMEFGRRKRLESGEKCFSVITFLLENNFKIESKKAELTAIVVSQLIFL